MIRLSEIVGNLCFLLVFLALLAGKLGAQGAIGPYLNGHLPERTPGAQGAWEVVDIVPDCEIPSPLKFAELPNENSTFVLSKIGEIWKLDLESFDHELVLDLKDRSFKLGEAGMTGIALHPKFTEAPEFNFLFLYYRTKPNPDEWSEKGYNVLSKFYWNADTGEFEKDSEEILFRQYDRKTWHNGGGLFFGNDGFLYLTVGDEGLEPEFTSASTQRIDGGFFSGVLRIDIDNDPLKSHPIRRQPVQLDEPPETWPSTFSQGYSIPNDNPWLSEEGAFLEEFWSIGLRSPYWAFYDDVSDEIWITDAGLATYEEINVCDKEDNFQWPYVEGKIPGILPKPDSLIGNEKPHFLAYNRDVGNAIVGGSVYRGSEFPQLADKFLFADYAQRRILAVDIDAIDPDPEVLITDIENFGIIFPEKPGVTGVSLLSDGRVFITVAGAEGGYFTDHGKILQLRNRELIPDPPSKLSDIPVFKDLSTLEPHDGLIPYTVNAPLWSDRAIKKRWVAIPNDGIHDSPTERIEFNPLDSWSFPSGTVFVKHFELPTDLENQEELVRLETRLFVIGEDGIGYGLTYVWNDEGTEAFLASNASLKNFDIYRGGDYEMTQTWIFPNRANCMTCHNSNADFVLGVNTHQLNSEIIHPISGQVVNQLDFLDEYNVLDGFEKFTGYLKAFNLYDSSIPLELRIRSYLDANCAFCHRENGPIQSVDMDLRLVRNLGEMGIVNTETQSSNSLEELLVVPGSYESSELWKRDALNDENRMPPLASNLIDNNYIDSLAKWIDNLAVFEVDLADIKISPNPATDYLRLDAGDDWLPRFDARIYDVNGREIWVREVMNGINFINVQNFTAGTYFIEFSNGRERLVKKFFVVKGR